MTYRIIDERQYSFIDRVLRLRNCEGRKEELLTNSFIVNKEQERLLLFKEKLLSRKDKKFFIVGDYDCDGITSTAITKSLFQHLSIRHNFYIPSRFKDGYGLTPEMVETASRHDFDVIYCLDNGVSAFPALKRAQELGLEVMIVDHHEYSEEPDVYGFLHPLLLEEGYRDCCTAGLAYLLYSLFAENERNLCYAGLATVADVVDLFGYNRFLVKEGLRLMNQHKAPAIDALYQGRDDYDVHALSFGVIPKINAVSRLEGKANPNQLVHYLLASGEECRAVASQIEKVNALRKNISQKMLSEALREEKEGAIYFYSSENYEEGLCGILAGRLTRQFGRPVLVFSRKNGILKGSGRSLKGCNLFEVLNRRRDLLLSFGGHELAVGISLSEEKENDFQDYLKGLAPFPVQEEEEVLLLKDEDLLLENADILQRLAPYGQGFSEVLFALEKPEILTSTLLKEKYPKFLLKNGVEAISFHKEHYRKEGRYWIGHLERNDFASPKVSFRIKDII